MTKAPVRVKELGIQALRYLASTLPLALEYRHEVGPEFGEADQIPVARSLGSLEIYADASHAPGGGRSTQGVVVAWRSALIFWESTKQPFVTLSSAESELVAMVSALQTGESIAPVIEELTGSDVHIALLGDNQAAIASFGPSSGWRNRHLRMRAAAARERVAAGTLSTTYVPGSLQVAHVATKPLATGRALALLSIVNVRLPSENAPSVSAAKFYGRPIGLSHQGADNRSPATLAPLALLVSASPAQAVKLRATQLGSWGLIMGGRLVTGQPRWDLDEMQGLLGWVVFGMCVLVASVAIWVLSRLFALLAGYERTERAGQVPVASHEASVALSPRLRQEISSSSSGNNSQTMEGNVEQGVVPPTSRGGSHNVEGCVFPIVGRTDYRANWVPAHFLRYLLSVAGGVMFTSLDPHGVEVWRMRALGRTFCYGVAFAYEKALGMPSPRSRNGSGPAADLVRAQPERAQADEEATDDPTIDEVRHDPEGAGLGEPLQDVQLFRHEDPNSSSESNWSGTSTATSGLSEGPQSLEPGESEAEESMIGEASSTSLVSGVSYRALDGALIVVHVDHEFCVPLPVWSLEEVGAIVVSIQRGEWSLFHEVLGLSGPGSTSGVVPIDSEDIGMADGEVAYGSERSWEDVWGMSGVDEQDLPPLETLSSAPEGEPGSPSAVGIVVNQIGAVSWIAISVVLLMGVRGVVRYVFEVTCGLVEAKAEEEGPFWNWPISCEAGSEIESDSRAAAWIARGLFATWWASASYRMGFFLASHCRDPSRCVFELPGYGTVARVPVGSSFWWVVWIFVVVLVGLLHPAEAHLSIPPDSDLDFPVV